jgi:hypothetical protein
MNKESNILEVLKKDLIVNEVQLSQKIKVDEETHQSLIFLEDCGIPMNVIIKEALSTWRKKGVIGIASEIKKQAKNIKNDDGIKE